MKIKYLCALLLAALIYSCDDSTTGIGTDLIPGGDKIPANTDSYEFTTKSPAAVSAEVELPHATRPIPMVIAITRARIFFIIFPPFPCPYITDTD